LETHIESNKKKITLSKKIVNKIINRDTLSLVVFISVFLVLWQLVYLSEIFPKLSLPSPLAVGQTIIELLLELKVQLSHYGDCF
jgi:NitT/TauT family transport system permease protein